jgi:hypothetical protein
MDGQPQTFGMLLVPVDGEPQFVWPITGDQEVNDARRAIGLPSVTEDRRRYQRGARPGPFLWPYTKADWVLWGAQTRSCWRPAVLYRVTERYRGQSEAGERLGWPRRPCAGGVT